MSLTESMPFVLLVDDEEEILDFLDEILASRYKIFKAASGAAALQILEHESIHLIVSDVMMPQMDGFELCRIIKSSVAYSHIPVVLLTARSTLQSKVEGLELGADAYIEKPFSKELLFAQIASLLTNRKMIRDYFATSPLVNLKSIAHTRNDECFLESLNSIIEKYLDDTELNVEKIAGFMNMSRITLYRKIKAISHLTPVELINITRLKKAAELLSTSNYKVFEVAYMVGFTSPSNFTRNFHKQFNISPSEYIHKIEKEKKKRKDE